MTFRLLARLAHVTRCFHRSRRSSVMILAGFMSLPILGLVGLAVDFALWNQAYAALSIAANGAALNAVKTAVTAKAAGSSTYLAAGQASGAQWLIAQIGAKPYAATLLNVTPSVTFSTSDTNLIAKATISADVQSVFGVLFSVAKYKLNLEVDATLSIAPFLEVVFLLDNSSSMLIGATPSDMATLSSVSPCDPSNYYYNAGNGSMVNNSKNNYQDYQYNYDGNTYNSNFAAGLPKSPVTLTTLTGGTRTLASVAPSSSYPTANTASCQGLINNTATTLASSVYPGPPCAFACHWTNSTNANGTTQDLLGMARTQKVSLRIDLLKTAVNELLSQMYIYNQTLNTLTTGIYAFNTSVTQVYPANCVPGSSNCEAGDDFQTAESLLGAAPGSKGNSSLLDQGLLPNLAQITGNNNDTAIVQAISSLSKNYVTAAGDGTTVVSPRKVLFIITDGFEDDPNTGVRQAMPASTCDYFKNTLGYNVFVVYTPYYPVMHSWYLTTSTNAIKVVEGTDTNSLSYNLQNCASSLDNYASASDQTSLTLALEQFLSKAINDTARFLK